MREIRQEQERARDIGRMLDIIDAPAAAVSVWPQERWEMAARSAGNRRMPCDRVKEGVIVLLRRREERRGTDPFKGL